jgi:dihydroorotate dehydrogenase electron transfer subunit
MLSKKINSQRNVILSPLEHFSVIESREEAKDIHSLVIESKKIAEASRSGQYMMLIRPMYDTNPMSFSLIDRNENRVGITFKVLGESTKEYASLEVGDKLAVQLAPCGNSYSLPDKEQKILCVGGGVGIANLLPLVNEIHETGAYVDFIAGFKTQSEAFFLDILNDRVNSLIVTTNDGSFCQKGDVLTALNQLKHKSGNKLVYDKVYSCGKELMMYKVFQFIEAYGLEGEFSLERFVRCGRGVCGNCAIDGYLVCQDGPIFSSKQLRGIKDFGKRKLDLSAISIPINQPYSKAD